MIKEIILESKNNNLTYKNLKLLQINKSFYTNKQNKINKPIINIKSNNDIQQNNRKKNYENSNKIFSLNNKVKADDIKKTNNTINNYIYIPKNTIKLKKNKINSSINKKNYININKANIITREGDELNKTNNTNRTNYTNRANDSNISDNNILDSTYINMINHINKDKNTSLVIRKAIINQTKFSGTKIKKKNENQFSIISSSHKKFNFIIENNINISIPKKEKEINLFKKSLFQFSISPISPINPIKKNNFEINKILEINFIPIKKNKSFYSILSENKIENLYFSSNNYFNFIILKKKIFFIILQY